MQNYILWSVKYSGWLTPSGTYTSLRKDAAVYKEAEALELAKRFKGLGSEFGLIPVGLKILERI